MAAASEANAVGVVVAGRVTRLLVQCPRIIFFFSLSRFLALWLLAFPQCSTVRPKHEPHSSDTIVTVSVTNQPPDHFRGRHSLGNATQRNPTQVKRSTTNDHHRPHRPRSNTTGQVTGTRSAWDTLHPKRSLGRPDAQTLPRSVPSRSRLSFGRRGENEASILERQKSPRLKTKREPKSRATHSQYLSSLITLSPYSAPTTTRLWTYLNRLHRPYSFARFIAKRSTSASRRLLQNFRIQLPLPFITLSQAQAGIQTNALCSLPSSWTTSFPLVVVIARIASFCSPSSSSTNTLRPSDQLQYHPRRPPSIPTFLPFRYHRVQLPSRSRSPALNILCSTR